MKFEFMPDGDIIGGLAPHGASGLKFDAWAHQTRASVVSPRTGRVD